MNGTVTSGPCLVNAPPPPHNPSATHQRNRDIRSMSHHRTPPPKHTSSTPQWDHDIHSRTCAASMHSGTMRPCSATTLEHQPQRHSQPMARVSSNHNRAHDLGTRACQITLESRSAQTKLMARLGLFYLSSRHCPSTTHPPHMKRTVTSDPCLVTAHPPSHEPSSTYEWNRDIRSVSPQRPSTTPQPIRDTSAEP